MKWCSAAFRCRTSPTRTAWRGVSLDAQARDVGAVVDVEAGDGLALVAFLQADFATLTEKPLALMARCRASPTCTVSFSPSCAKAAKSGAWWGGCRRR